jgi:tryptophan 7-halogenase
MPMARPRDLPQAIAIVGPGQLGVLVAIALRQALPRTTITVVASPPNPAAFADTIGTALPFTNRLHDRLGIDEMDLVRKAGASHRLVTRYRGWSDSEQDNVCDYGNGAQTLGNAFTGKFDGVRKSGSDTLVVSPAIALAAMDRFRPADGDPDSPLAGVDYALRWNVEGYRDLLIERAMALGVHYVPQIPIGIERHETGDISTLILDEEAGRIEADLFIDCSGPDRWLIGQMEGVDFDSWADYLPCDQMFTANPGKSILALDDLLSLTPHGWMSDVHGRDGIHRTLAFPSVLGTAEAEQILIRGGAASAVNAVIRPGALAKPFVGNVVALGDAAASFEPLGGANLDMAHRQLSMLLELLPGRVIDPLEREEYNRRAALMADATLTWLASHYLTAGQSDTPFAKHVKQLKQTPRLVRLADQYHRHARLPFMEEAPMLPGEWIGLLRALGVQSSPSAHALAQPEVQARAMLQQAEYAIQAALAEAPLYGEWMQKALSASTL